MKKYFGCYCDDSFNYNWKCKSFNNIEEASIYSFTKKKENNLSTIIPYSNFIPKFLYNIYIRNKLNNFLEINIIENDNPTMI
jgi:hypothetical protein